VIVAALLSLHYVLAARSLLTENATVDEVVHLPAGVTYWQKGTFRLYHHNPPLAKLLAALPVIWARPETATCYESPSWNSRDPSPPTYSQVFAYANRLRYFELFQLARLMMPFFSIVGGLAVFAWSRRLYGTWGGLLSLSLWVFCPNVLAHARLITSDIAATALGVAATFCFWRYLQQPAWLWAMASGFVLGIAQLTKFSMLVLYAVWPFLWVARLALVVPGSQRIAQTLRGIARGAAIVAISIVTIDAGYFFEGLGIRLGQFEFGSKALTRPVPPGVKRPHSKNELLEWAWQFRVNRFRGTWLEKVPCPLPEHYVLGFDEQKIETEGVPTRFIKAVRSRAVEEARAVRETSDEERTGYSVYLNGVMRHNGWWYYYILTLLYKVPEGTWILVLLSLPASLATIRTRAALADEITLWTIPLVILLSISFLTDINLGLRYVLPIAPYVFIACGKVAPWAAGLRPGGRGILAALAAGSLAATVVASVLIYPHYLAYFNWSAGGPDRVPARLIDSNLDWGQDLVGLERYCKETIPGEPIGLAFFGQINPSIFATRGEPFRWFLPPVPPRTTQAMGDDSRLIGPARSLEPGYYAVSATLLYGLPWRLYDPAPPDEVVQARAPAWNVLAPDAFAYFRRFEPIKKIGHSIYVYHLSKDDVAGVAALFDRSGR
jgi:4-amino-4-deoxy-L-arabinose transferase-like glycosyltransferase